MTTTEPTTTAEPVTIDLDAARKARKEKKGPAPSIKFLGVDRPLPQSLPAEVIDLMADVGAGDYTASTKAFRLLLGGDETYETLLADAKEAGEPLDLEDVVFLLEECLRVYEVTAGESPASGSSS